MAQTVRHFSAGSSAYEVIASDDLRISEVTRQLAMATQSVWSDRGRRAQDRIPYPKLISMVPLSNDDLQPAAEPVYVIGKQLAPLGFDFFHHHPIEQRFAIVSFETGAEHFVQLLLKITWCRFLKQGWYDSGGKFVKLVSWNPQPPSVSPHIV